MDQAEEANRAHDTLFKGTCFISKEPLNNKDYELVWHAGAQSYVFIDKNFTTSKKETLNEQSN